MKGLKCSQFSFYLLAIFSVLACSLLTSSTASAFSVGRGGHGEFLYGINGSRMGIYFNDVDGQKWYNAVAGQNGSIRISATGDSQVPSGGQVNNLALWASSSIPSQSLISFSIRYVVPSNYTYLQFNGLGSLQGAQSTSGQWGAWQGSILNQSCKTNNILQDTSTTYGESDFTCEYLILTSNNTPVSNAFLFAGQIAYVQASRGITMIISPYSWVTLDNESGGGGTDVSDIEDLLQDILDQLEDNNYATSLSNITSVLNQIKNSNPSASDIATAITEAEEAEMLDAQDDAQSSVDDAQDDVDSASATLIQQISTLVTGLRQVQPSNCVIAFDLFSTSAYGRGSSAHAYDIDLCALSRPASFQVVDQILKVVWVVGAILMVLNAMLGLFREVQGGGE